MEYIFTKYYDEFRSIFQVPFEAIRVRYEYNSNSYDTEESPETAAANANSNGSRRNLADLDDRDDDSYWNMDDGSVLVCINLLLNFYTKLS